MAESVAAVYFFFSFLTTVIPMGFLPWEILVAFPGGKPAMTESRYPIYGACCVF